MRQLTTIAILYQWVALVPGLFVPGFPDYSQQHFRDQVRYVMATLSDLLADGKSFLFGRAPSVADLAAYHPLWFVVTRTGNRVELLPGNFPRVVEWMDRMEALGHGRHSDMTSAEAIEVARTSKPVSAPQADPDDPSGFKPGDQVTVTPDDTGRDPAAGELVTSSVREIVIRRTDERAGTVHVHFPRLGFIVVSK